MADGTAPEVRVQEGVGFGLAGAAQAMAGQVRESLPARYHPIFMGREWKREFQEITVHICSDYGCTTILS